MKTVVQRVANARVVVDGQTVGAIERGVLALVGVAHDDAEADAVATAHKIATLRMFPGRTPMDLDLAAIGGSCLVVSQFTLCGSLRKGRRPSFDGAAAPELAEALYERVCDELRSLDIPVQTGRFRARMLVDLVNDGPVTLIVETRAGAML